jgi:hypothetical protein
MWHRARICKGSMNNLEVVSKAQWIFTIMMVLHIKRSTINAPRLRKIICFPRLAIEFIIANCLLNRNTVLLSLSLLYLGKYRLKKKKSLPINRQAGAEKL